MKEIIGEKDTQRFLEFANNIESKSIEESTVLDLSSDYTDKKKRTEVH